jgi:hypothetical protein
VSIWHEPNAGSVAGSFAIGKATMLRETPANDLPSLSPQLPHLTLDSPTELFGLPGRGSVTNGGLVPPLMRNGALAEGCRVSVQ